MRFYRVELDKTFSDVYFDFVDYGEAMGFIGTALENGHKNGEGISAKIYIKDEEVGLYE